MREGGPTTSSFRGETSLITSHWARGSITPLFIPNSRIRPIRLIVGWSGMRSYGKEYITASLIREFLMLAVFRMLDPLLFYVLPESVLIPMLCGAEHLLFAGIKLFLCRGLGLCLFARMDSSSSRLGGVDTLARIRVTATRDKSKGNCIRPGMDVNSVKLGRGFENRVGSFKIQIRKEFQTFMHAPPYKCCVQVPARIIGKDQTHLNRSHHSSSSVKALRGPPEGSGYLLELRPTTTGQFRFGATPYSTIIIGVWGSRQRKIKAAYQFFLYTLLGSVFMLLAILLILLQTGTTDLQISLTTEFSERRQIFLWIASFASFAVKVPMVPVHIWLPEAHVEAPTAGSVILAGIPSKLGTHGFLRFSIPMFPEATLCSTPFIYTPSAIAIIYTSLTTSRQIDLKKIIAYSSVAHMNLVTIGMFSRAAAVRSPILSYGHTRPKHVCRACDPSTY
ncbi:hypothetical protein FNV43_RR08315 [Rhamnella rubrinervis]|uniref:NADH-ubiquinone oxidoreductase chain 4 n=1 Tax=Rhamnella rubrinervis TaxID=2594499 RepID=A0A8K0HGI9_9ROSA|nr:hypothetical protein FNV43_RR08315 [Rhamnella rubrinervis]